MQPSPSMDSDSDVVRRRAPHAKTRTGCRTCKARRIKCDETKPSCEKCTGSGRKCEGYESTFKNREDRFLKDRAPSATMEARHKEALVLAGLARAPAAAAASTARRSDRESFAFEYFRTKTVTNAQAFFTTSFWTTDMLHICEKEPSIRCAAIALASLQLLMGAANPSSGAVTSIQNDSFALEYYNRAMQLLQQRLAGADNDPSVREIVLAACVLFTTIEFVQQNYENAITHLQAGFNILTDSGQRLSPDPSGGGGGGGSGRASPERANSPASALMEGGVSEILMRLDVGSRFFAAKEPCFEPFIDRDDWQDPARVAAFERQPAFNSVGHCRLYYDMLTTRVIKFLSTARRHMMLESRISALKDDALLQEFRGIQHMFGYFDRALDLLAARIRAQSPLLRRDLVALDLLRVNRNCVYMIPLTVLSRDREIWAPGADELCAKTVDVCARLAERPASITGDVAMLGLGVIAPLYCVALKCTNADVAASAVRLLARLQHREGGMDGRDIARGLVESQKRCGRAHHSMLAGLPDRLSPSPGLLLGRDLPV